MKVLIVTNVYPSEQHPYHGIFVSEQVQSIQKLYPDVLFDVYYIDGLHGKWNYVKSIWEVSQKINKGSYDLIHIHYGLSGLFLYWPFIKNTKILVTFHGSDIQPLGGNGIISVKVSQHTAKKSDAAIVLNDNMNHMVLPYCSKTHLIPCAVNINTFSDQPAQKKKDVIRVVFPSNPNRTVKNYPLFCDTLQVVRKRYGLKVEEVHLVNLSREQVADVYNQSDVLLMTSKSEGSPQAIKEAMACNLSCVSTPVGDVRDLLDGVKDCYVSNTHDANELADLLVKSIKKDGEGMLGRDKIILLQLDEESIAKKIYGLYKETIGELTI